MIDYAKQIDNFHIVVILETGINRKENMRDIADDLNITRINYMPEIEKDKYQHTGSGTAILTHFDMEYQPTKDMYNDDKKIS